MKVKSGYMEILHSYIRQRRITPLLMIDIDYFKQYNGYYGHVKGDAGIKALAETLSDSVRRKDLVIRYGGEEMLYYLLQRGRYL
ncbi:MAG: diguanylate cyclase [Lachnospiraceae bacterium]|nr:diguanylate cyclase [Lachnospiraceae bacterium]